MSWNTFCENNAKGFSEITQIITDIHRSHGKKLNFAIDSENQRVNLTIGTEDWSTNLVVFEGSDLSDCSRNLRIAVEDLKSKSKLITYINGLNVIEKNDNDGSLSFPPSNEKQLSINDFKKMSLKSQFNQVASMSEPGMTLSLIESIIDAVSKIEEKVSNNGS